MPNETAYHTRLERILGVPLAEDAVRQWPQSGERIDGRVRIGEVESHFVGLRLGVGRRHALGDTIVVEWSTDYGDGRVYRNVSIAELRDGEAIRVTDYWASRSPRRPGERRCPPAWTCRPTGCGRPPTSSRTTETGSGDAMLQEGPGTQPAMQLRVARHTARLQEVVRFYRDGIGLTQIGGFCDHDGYDGVFLAVPSTGAHLELTAGGGHGAPAPHPESLLVFYLGDEARVQAVAARLGVGPVPPPTRTGPSTG